MAQFDFLKKRLDVSESTSTFCIDGTDIEVSLAYAGESNKPYWQAKLKRSKKLDRLVRTLSNMPTKKRRETEEEIGRASLEMVRELFPVFIIRGWSGVPNEDGEEVPYHVDAAQEFMDALPDDIALQMVQHAQDPSNYYDDLDVEATAKNSERGSNGNSVTNETDTQSAPR